MKVSYLLFGIDSILQFWLVVGLWRDIRNLIGVFHVWKYQVILYFCMGITNNLLTSCELQILFLLVY